MNAIASSAAELIRSPSLDELSEPELRAAIETILPLQVETIQLAGQTMRWYRAADPDCLLEEAVTTASVTTGSVQAADIDPFWAADWRAAFGIDAYLARLDVRGLRVLELGAGSGEPVSRQQCAAQWLPSPIPSTWPCWSRD